MYFSEGTAARPTGQPLNYPMNMSVAFSCVIAEVVDRAYVASE